jgi:hypothetical protein
MIGKIQITLRDQPGIFAQGYELRLYAPGDPIPIGLQVTETVTAARHYLTTGEDNHSLARVVQKVAYNRYRLRLYARPSDNTALINSGRHFQIVMEDATVHIAEVVEFNDAGAGSINARQIDIEYIDINPDNYQQQPVNNYLSSAGLAAKVAAGMLTNAKLCRLIYVIPLTTSAFFLTALKPVAGIGDVEHPESDVVKGLTRHNVTNLQDLFNVTMYVNEADKKEMQRLFVKLGGVTGTEFRLAFGNVVYTAVETPVLEFEQIPEAVDLWLCNVTFKYDNHYIYNY